MPCCAAPSCSNNVEKGYKLFAFPSDRERRRIWLRNLRRDNWEPTRYSKLCEAHFEESQFEQRRADGLKKLTPIAVPTVFPKPLTRTLGKLYKGKVRKPEVVGPFKDQGVLQGLPDNMFEERQLLHEAFPTDDNMQQYVIEEVHEVQELPIGQHDTHQPRCSNPLEEQNDVIKDISDKTSEEHQFLPLQTVQTKAVISYSKENVLKEVIENMSEEQQPSKTPQLSPQKNARGFNDMQDVECWILKQKCAVHRTENCKMRNRLRTMFTTDQVEKLAQNSGDVVHWPQKALQEGILTRCTIGEKGYEFLRQQLKMPYPSYSEICGYLRNLLVCPGLLTEVIERLKLKCTVMKDFEKDCIISLDEMPISHRLDYDRTLETILGHVTLGSRKLKVASHILAVTVHGISTPWKQLVAYHFTGSSVNGQDLQVLVNDVRSAVYKAGFRIRGVVSSIGLNSESMWESSGISAGMTNVFHVIQSKTKNENCLYFFADATNVLIHIRNAFLNNLIYIPHWLMKQENLPSNEIEVKYLKALQSMPKGVELLLEEPLTNNHFCPDNHQESDINLAAHLMSDSVARALDALIFLGNIPTEAKTTVWFLHFVHRWFQLSTSTSQELCLSKSHPSYTDNIEFLEKSIEIMKQLRFGRPNMPWQSFQTGFILTTNSILDLQEELQMEGHKFVYTNNFTCDRFASMLSVFRHEGGTTPTQLCWFVRALCIMHILKPTYGSSYQQNHLEVLQTLQDEFSEEVLKETIAVLRPLPDEGVEMELEVEYFS